ncbi:MAG: SRPBCC domain-containing protein [Flavobacteriales bacterium]|nr:SRPBCC domain-containing protein [Flavobacteriales bacterium]
MSELIKFQLEYPFHSSINILYKRLSTPSGLSEWFADDVHIRGNIYTFFWDGSEQEAKLLKSKENEFVRFHWLDNEVEESYFEFTIQVDDLTNDVSLIITDFAEDETEIEENTLLWDTQVESLKHALGS